MQPDKARTDVYGSGGQRSLPAAGGCQLPEGVYSKECICCHSQMRTTYRRLPTTLVIFLCEGVAHFRHWVRGHFGEPCVYFLGFFTLILKCAGQLDDASTD